MRGRQAGREWGIHTHVHLVDLILHWLYPQHSLAVLSNNLFPYHLDPNYILIRREWQSENSIILTTQLPWKLPSFSFPWQEIISMFSVILTSSTPLALFSHVGLALKNTTWHLVSSQLKRYQFLDLMSAVPRSKARNIKVDIYYLFHGLHQWCFSLPFFIIIADVLPIMLRSLLKSVCPLQTNIHINVIHQQLTNASSIRRLPHTQRSHCFCRTLWVWEECRIGLLGRILELETFSPSPRNAQGRLEQQPGALAQGVGDAAFSPCIVSRCRGETNARLWGEQKLKKRLYFPPPPQLFGLVFSLPFPISLACLWSSEWVIQGLACNCGQKIIWDQSEMLFQPVHPSDHTV